MKGNEGAWLVMATLVSLQLLRFSGVEDYHASPCSVSACLKTAFSSRLFQGSGLRIASRPGVISVRTLIETVTYCDAILEFICLLLPFIVMHMH